MRPALLAILAVVALAACASSPPASQAAPAAEFVELENAVDGTRVALKKGGELKVVMDANPSTGFNWQGPPSVAPTLSSIGQRIFVSKSTNPMDLGAGGYNIFRFRAEEAGKSTLTLEYRRPWETAPAKVVKYEVIVE